MRRPTPVAQRMGRRVSLGAWSGSMSRRARLRSPSWVTDRRPIGAVFSSPDLQLWPLWA